MKHITFTVVERDGIFKVSLCPPKSLIVNKSPIVSDRSITSAIIECVELIDDDQRDIMEFAHDNDLKDYATVNDKHW